MKIYYIVVSSWDGNTYTMDYVRPFLSKQNRDDALAKMKESPAFKKADIWLDAEEDEVEDAPKNEPVTDLPTWKKVTNKVDDETTENVLTSKNVIIHTDELGYVYYISREELFNKLPKEE